MELVSVIIPVFNGEATLAQTLDSVLGQTHTHLQVVVVDDGSTDGTVELISTYSDPRLELLTFSNSGAHITRNRGIEAARGAYLTFLDADDWWSEDKVEKQLARLDAVPEAGVVYSFTQYVDEQNRYLHRGYEEPIEGDVLTEIFVRFFLQSGSNAMVRREVIDRIGGFDTSLEVCDDYDFYVRAAEHFEFALVPEHQIYYRVRAGSLSSQAQRMRKASHQVIRRAVAREPQVLGPLRLEAMVITDGYIFTKALESPREWRNIALCASCLWTHIRAGRPGWKALYARRDQATYWLARVGAWILLPTAVKRELRRLLERRRQRKKRLEPTVRDI